MASVAVGTQAAARLGHGGKGWGKQGSVVEHGVQRDLGWIRSLLVSGVGVPVARTRSLPVSVPQCP